MSQSCGCTEQQLLEKLYLQNLGLDNDVPRSAAVRSGSFNRPSDTNNYANGDMVMNSTTVAALQTINDCAFFAGRGGVIQNAVLTKSGTGVTGAAFEAQIFAGPGGVAPAQDNALANVLLANLPYYIGSIIFPTMAVGGGAANTAARAVATNLALVYATLGDVKLYWALKCLAAYTDEASAETFTLTLGLLRDW